MPLYVCVPLVFIEAALIVVRPVPVVSVVKGVVPPVIPAKVCAVAPARVRANAPSSGPANFTREPSRDVLLLSDTAPLYVCVPLVFIEVVSIVVSPVPVVRADNGVVPPTIPEKVCAVPPARVSANAPLSVLIKFTSEPSREAV